MRLPRQEQASRSMASTMRKPVLEGNRKESRAAVQKFTPMPTNYNQVGSAQASAALAQNRIWDQVSKLGTQMSQIDYEQQRAALAAKKARLLEFATAYGTDVATTDLTQKAEGTLTSKYKLVGADFQEALARRDEELDEEFDITDPRLKEEWKNIKIGIRSETSSYLAKLVDAAKDKESKNNAQTALIGLNTKDEYEVWEAEHGQWFDPVQLDGFKRAKYNEIEVKGIRRRLQNDPDFNSNVHIREYAETETERLANGELFEEGYNAIIRELDARLKKNISDAQRTLASEIQTNPVFQVNASVLGQISVLDKQYAEDKIGPGMYEAKRRMLEQQLAKTLTDSNVAYMIEVANMAKASEIDVAQDTLLNRLNLPEGDPNKLSAQEFESQSQMLEKRRNDLNQTSAQASAKRVSGLNSNREISREKARIKGLNNLPDGHKDKITDDEFFAQMELLDRQEQQNYVDAELDLNKLDESTIHIMTEYYSRIGNLKDPNASWRKADIYASQWHTKQASEKVMEAQEIFEDGDSETALSKISEIIESLPEEYMDPADYKTARNSVLEAASTMIEESLVDILSKENLFVTDLVDDDGVIRAEENTQGSKSAEFLRDLSRKMLADPKAWGLDEDNKVREIAQRMTDLQSIVATFAKAEEDAIRKRVEFSEKTLFIQAGSQDPSTIATIDFTNFNEDDKRAWVQETFEAYVDNREERTALDYGDPYKPGPTDNIPDVHTYALEFTFASGFAPPGYVEQLSGILNNPRMPDNEASDAAKRLIDVLSVNPGARSQEGLKQEGFETALAMAHYIRMSGSPKGADEFLAARRQEALDPTGFANKVKTLREGSKSGGLVNDVYSMIAAQNPWMPKELDDRIYDHVATIIGEQYNIYKSEPAAMHMAINIALNQWGAEVAYKTNSDGKVEETKIWKFNSIYKLGAGANPAMPADKGSLGVGWFDMYNNKISQQDRNNFVQQTIDDYAEWNGFDPAQVSTQWVGPASLDPRYRDHPKFKDGGWVLTNHAGTQLFDNEYFQKTGIKVPIFIGMNDMSPKAAEMKENFEGEQRYESAKGAYDDWQKYMSISEDSSKYWALTVVEGVARWFESNDKQKWKAVEELKLSGQEAANYTKDIQTWEEKSSSAAPGSIEEATAIQVIEMMRSHPYRAAYLEGQSPADRKILHDLMIQNAISVTETFYKEREAKEERDKRTVNPKQQAFRR